MLTPVLRQQISTEIDQKSHALEPRATGIPVELRQLAGIRCVAFDVYGTLLVSTAGDIGTAADASAGASPFSVVANAIGLSPEHAQAVAETFHERIAAHHDRARNGGIAHPEVDICTVWRETMTRCGASDAIQPELVAITYELAANPVWLMPETRSVFHWLAKHGFRIALVSNAQFYTPLILETLLGRSLTALKIDPRVWSFELGEAKPSPKPFQDLIRQLAAEGIGPGETLYVGNDMLNDIVTAQDQGIRAVLFAGDARSMRLRRGTPRVEGRAPDAVITALSQLPTVIESR